jgi:hypothetical protein
MRSRLCFESAATRTNSLLIDISFARRLKAIGVRDGALVAFRIVGGVITVPVAEEFTSEAI